jgi:hypothetical protein
MIEQEMTYFLDSFLLGTSRRYRPMKYESLKITFWLSAPISLTHPWMHFDGLIGHLLTIDALGQDFYLLPRKFPLSRMLRQVKIPPFPIKHTRGMYHASASIFDTGRKSLEIMYKKFEDRWAGGRRKVSKGMGYFRDYMIQHIYIPTKTVIFYVMGDRKTLEQLCHLVTGLGDNTRVGWGAVRRHEIEDMQQDWSIIKNGIAMRPIPEKLIEYTSLKVAVAWKPPYWAPECVGICAPPGAEVKLKNG